MVMVGYVLIFLFVVVGGGGVGCGWGNAIGVSDGGDSESRIG